MYMVGGASSSRGSEDCMFAVASFMNRKRTVEEEKMIKFSRLVQVLFADHFLIIS